MIWLALLIGGLWLAALTVLVASSTGDLRNVTALLKARGPVSSEEDELP